ncbi:5'/3'-nucleotidase SurE [Thiohalorhabdus methylotrophus]|uniref:5'-nucleotidase SurE n=1 Tax=Thiohalorhabdus methylotrophus TaxID=3242694 RepID=A0ABV4TWD2_9GAMM
MILISNDDGYRARGIQALSEHLRAVDQVLVVAPEADRSAASNALTLLHPLRARRITEDTFAIDGTPSDCVHIALGGVFEVEPTVVVSGINHGSNMGDDVVYSGTVAAAVEARHLDTPSMAVSLVGRNATHFETAARVAAHLTGQLLCTHQLPPQLILNVNIPDLPFEELKGVQVTRLGNRHASERVVVDKDPRGETIFWIGSAGPEADSGPGTDFHAVRSGYVSVTPLGLDMTHYESMQEIEGWLQGAPMTPEQE